MKLLFFIIFDMMWLKTLYELKKSQDLLHLHTFYDHIIRSNILKLIFKHYYVTKLKNDNYYYHIDTHK